MATAFRMEHSNRISVLLMLSAVAFVWLNFLFNYDGGSDCDVRTFFMVLSGSAGQAYLDNLKEIEAVEASGIFGKDMGNAYKMEETANTSDHNFRDEVESKSCDDVEEQITSIQVEAKDDEQPDGVAEMNPQYQVVFDTYTDGDVLNPKPLRQTQY
ncbi:unnamed protein product [Allacma fusca]|uniref:Uncharacterized protein n=1 Tax=Allacma fusca TaxID=39272 RepID=A0A8J2KSI1_9HEXA|nr:unnamed protein product [Allacma fusca]